jgi:DNA-binding NarL/FixJ family response regulator
MQEPVNVISIVIADDHPIVAEGLTNVLRPYDHFSVDAVYATGKELLEGLADRKPDVLLLDIHFPDTTGNQLIRILSKEYPMVKVLALTSADNVYDVKDMLQHGCLGYLLKSAPLPVLVEAIDTVYKGRQFLQPEIKEQLLQSLVSRPQKQVTYKLTQREQTILQLISEGRTNNEIAAQLFLSHRTIENNRLSLYQKLGVKNSAELIRTALQQGLLS